MTFPLILVVVTAIIGLYWLADWLIFSRNRTGDEPILVEYARQFFPVLLIVVSLRSFIFEPFRIPSGSMIPTLLVGDFILVSKFSYGVRLPVIHTKILNTGLPENGDVAVFRYPEDPKVDYIKRVIGIPGDTVTFSGQQLTVNGEVVEVSEGEAYVMPGTDDIMFGATNRSEKLGDDEYEVLVLNTNGGMPRPNMQALGIGENDIVLNNSGGITEYTINVPEGMYFMMGDNRDRSADSRYFGFVPEANLVGQAKYVWMHWNKGILWSRLGESIK